MPEFRKYFGNSLSDIKVLFVLFLSLNLLTACESPKVKMSQQNTLVFHQQYEVDGLKFDFTKPNTRNGISLFWLQVYNQADIQEPNQKIR